jgi:hypothetical protein
VHVWRAQLSSSPDPAANPSTHAASDISNAPLHSPFQTRTQRSHPFSATNWNIQNPYSELSCSGLVQPVFSSPPRRSGLPLASGLIAASPG